MDTPQRIGDTWTCPPGYYFPKCPGCGHNYFEAKPQQGAHPPDGGLCRWCIEEMEDDKGSID